MSYNDAMSFAELDKTAAVQAAPVEAGARLLAGAVGKGRLIHIAAGDFASTAVLEAFVKPGMLCNFSPMREPTLSALHAAYRAYSLRQTERIGRYLYAYYRNTAPGDVLLVADSFAAPAALEMIAAAQKDGLPTIHISASGAASQADVVFSLASAGYPAASLLMLALVAEMNRQSILLLESKGVPFDVWLPFDEANDAENRALMEKYRLKIKQL